MSRTPRLTSHADTRRAEQDTSPGPERERLAKAKTRTSPEIITGMAGDPPEAGSLRGVPEVPQRYPFRVLQKIREIVALAVYVPLLPPSWRWQPYETVPATRGCGIADGPEGAIEILWEAAGALQGQGKGRKRTTAPTWVVLVSQDGTGAFSEHHSTQTEAQNRVEELAAEWVALEAPEVDPETEGGSVDPPSWYNAAESDVPRWRWVGRITRETAGDILPGNTYTDAERLAAPRGLEDAHWEYVPDMLGPQHQPTDVLLGSQAIADAAFPLLRRQQGEPTWSQLDGLTPKELRRLAHIIGDALQRSYANDVARRKKLRIGPPDPLTRAQLEVYLPGQSRSYAPMAQAFDFTPAG